MTPTAAELPMEPVLPLFFADDLKTPELPRFTTPDADLICGAEEKAAERKRILLVDDDDEIRRLMRVFLRVEGYQVFSCRNALLALEVFTACGDIDLLLTDLEMPVMSGDDLSERVTAMRPELPVVIVSGSVMTEQLLGRIETNGWQFLAKPCRVPELLAVVANRLAGGHAPARRAA